MFFVSLAQAQGESILPSLDLVTIGASVLVFAKIVQFIVEGAKKKIRSYWSGFEGWKVDILTGLVSLVMSFVLQTTGNLKDAVFLQFGPFWSWVLFAFASWWVASGWYQTGQPLEPPKVRDHLTVSEPLTK